MEFEFGYQQWYRWLAAPLGLGPKRAVVRVEGTYLHIQMGWAFRADVPLAAVTEIRRGDQRLIEGLGVHGRAGEYLVNGSSKNIVELAIDPAIRARAALRRVDLHTLRVSVADPDSLIAYVQALLRPPPPPEPPGATAPG